MIIRIEKEFGIRLPLTTLVEQNTIHKLSKIIEEGIAPDKWRSLVPLRPNGKKKPLFLIHGMGLNVLLYTTITNYLDPDQPVYGLQAKGLNGVEKPLETLEEIASYYISEIMTIDSDGPYQLAGYSLGGNIAYEMARQLTEMGKKVSFVGLLDTDAENLINPFSLSGIRYSGGKYTLNYIKWNILYLFKHPDESMFAAIRRRLSGLRKKVRGQDYKVAKKDKVSKGEQRELPKYLRNVHRANLKASRKYVIKPYNGCVHVFKATHQAFYIHDTVNYGWDKYALGGVVMHEVPGEHSGIFAPPNDKYFSSLLQKSLDESMIQSWTEKVS
jgi:thioesterase domain-containing protein